MGTKLAIGAGAAALAALGGTLLLAGGATAEKPDAMANLVDVNGNEVGVVTFYRHGPRTQVRANFTDAGVVNPNDFHGFHVHANAAGLGCVDSGAGPFTGVGGHWNPGGTTHGDHAGDMPSLYVRADGEADLWFDTDAMPFDGLAGTAVIVHAGRDNYANIPARYSATGPDAATRATGDAGGRVACGVVRVVGKD
jgi:superoxide dismutase, Cu-Zn family